MAANLVRAFNFSQGGDTAALVGPNRTRILGVLVNAAAACTFQLRNGTASGTSFWTLHYLQAGMTCIYPQTVY